MPPVADEPEAGLRQPGGGQPDRRHNVVDVLVALEDADEEGRRPLGQRRDGGLPERRQLGIGREDGGRLDARLAHQPRRERRERAHGVRVTDCDERRAVGERRDHGARR